jgi:hypothetical protein
VLSAWRKRLIKEQEVLKKSVSFKVTLEAVETLVDPYPLQSGTPNDSSLEARRGEPANWLARGAIVAVACGMAWYTWGHWGDFQIDCGRELYVPAAILKGKLLFRDIWYMYGPLAPYLKALLFRLFGVHLIVLYVFGLALTIGTALVTFEIARQFKLGLVPSVVPSLFFLVEAFYPFIRNFVFPYSYAASLAAFLGSCCLCFVIRHASTMRALHLGLAAIFASLMILTKQEFGFAGVVLLIFEIFAAYWMRRSWRELLRDIALCLAGLSPAIAGYAWFVWKVSAKVLFIENWVSTPGTYFMQHFGQRAMANQGFRLVPAELLEVTEYAVLAIAMWYVLASLNAFAIRILRLKTRPWMAVAVILCMSPLAISCFLIVKRAPWGMVIDPLRFSNSLWESSAARVLFASLTQLIFPSGLFLLVIAFLIHAVWQFWAVPANTGAIHQIALGTYAVLVSVRQMMDLQPTLYRSAVFFNVPAFLVLVILLTRVIQWAGRLLDLKSREFLSASMLSAETVFLFILFFPHPGILSARLVTDYGVFYTTSDIAARVPQIVSFMKTHTKNGRDILVLPEPPSLYVLAGMEAPNRWYSLMPGVVPPDYEQEYVNELVSNDVRYILIVNRSVAEYGVASFIEDGYNHGLYDWIMANYVRVGQFGPPLRKGEPSREFIVWIYARKDLEPKP